MKKMKRIIALTTVLALFAGQIQGQDCAPDCEEECCGDAYCDSGYASYMSAALPIGALAVAAIIIATTNRQHHHSSSSSSSSYTHASTVSISPSSSSYSN